MRYDHEGLQVAHGSGLEVSAAEGLRNPLDRRSSWTSPESMRSKEKPEIAKSIANEYTAPYSSERATLNETSQLKRSRSLSKRQWIMVIGAAVLIVVAIIAISLGVVLGKASHKETQSTEASGGQASTGPPNSNTTSLPVALQAQPLSGIAMVQAGDASGNSYGYYQDTDGNIREALIQNSSWRLQTAAGSFNLVAGSRVAKSNTPIAATTWVASGTTWRIVFFTNNSGQIVMSNKTNGDWSAPLTVVNSDTLLENGIGLDVLTCFGYDNGNAMRGFYASKNGWIKEFGFNGSPYAANGWDGQINYPLNGATDNRSGVGTTSFDNELHAFVRNNATGLLNEWRIRWSLTNITIFWTMVATTNTSAPPVALGSSITACNDGIGKGTDYIFYQTTNGSIVSVVSSPPEYTFSNIQILASAAQGSKFRATYDSGSLVNGTPGPILYYQTEGANYLSYLQLSGQGRVVASGTITG